MKTSKLTEQQVRDIINTWAQSIPHHQHREIGSELTIQSMQDIKAYVVTINSQFEKRYLSDSYCRIDIGKSYPSAPALVAKDVRLWSYDSGTKGSFMNKANQFALCESKYKALCDKCNGAGTVKCPSCSNGKVECSNCRGSGEVSYQVEHQCSSCHGSGTITKYKEVSEIVGYKDNTPITKYVSKPYSQRCGSCRGNGKIYETKYKRCSPCNGTGEVTCKTCGGRARIICSKCVGDKELIYYLTLHCDRRIYALSTCCSDVMSDGEKEVLIRDSKPSDFNHLRHDFNGEGRITTLSPAINSYTREGEEYLMQSAHSGESENNKIIFEKISIDEVPLTHLRYSYHGEEFNIYIIHNATHTVVADDSPIKETYSSLLQRAVNAAQYRRFSSALSSIRKCLDFPQAGDMEREFENQIIELLENSVKYGANIGLYISCLMLSLVGIYYYGEVNYVIKYFDYINLSSGFWNSSVLIAIPISFFLSFKTVGYCKQFLAERLFSLKSIVLRIGTGALCAAAISLLTWVAYALLCFIGIGTVLNSGAAIALTAAFYALIFAIMIVGGVISLIISAIQFFF